MNKETLKNAIEIAKMLDGEGGLDNLVPTLFWIIGKQYLIRTVTMIQVGTLKDLSDKEMVLSDASWIADTGRFHTMLQSGKFSEVEMFVDDVLVNRSSIIDATLFKHDLPKASK